MTADAPHGSSPGDATLVQELRSTLARLELALAQISDGLLICSSEVQLLWCNQAFERLIQRSRLQMLGADLGGLIAQLLPAGERRELQTLLALDAAGPLTVVARREPLQVLEIEWRSVPGEVPPARIFTFRDVSDRVSLEELRLRSQELLDHQLALAAEVVTCPVTGLPNRRGLLQAIQAALGHLPDHGSWIAVLFCDLDRFKEVNDTYGHSVGDRLLIELAQRMQRVLRPSDRLARLGGDEFVLLLDPLATPEDALRVAERLRLAVAQPWQPSQQALGLEIVPQISVGIAVTRDPTCSADQLLHNADLAMYEAKAAGTTPVEVFDDSIEQRFQRRIRIRRSLRRCLRQQRIAVELQPVVHLASGRIQGFEALVRPPAQDDLGISPQEFIGVAEASGLMLPLGALLLDACFSITENLDLQSYSHGLAVNLSTLQLSAAGIADQVLSAAQRHRIAPSSLVVEVTETALLEQPQRACNALAQLRAAGCRVLLDDFGTGYSSLTWLAEMPIDGLKIDRSFTASMHCDPRRRLMIEAVVNLARQLQLEVVAEGIETHDHRDALLGMGCQLGQGYYFSRPLPLDGLVALPPVLPAAASGFPPAAC